MRALLGSVRDDPELGRATISFTLSADDAWLLEHVRWLFDRVQPKADADQFIHWLVVEGITSLTELVPEAEMAEHHARAEELRAKVAAWRAQLRAWCDEAEARVEGGLELGVGVGVGVGVELGAEGCDWDRTFEDRPSAGALDEHVRALCHELAQRDLSFGALAERFWKRDGWRRLGHASEATCSRTRWRMRTSMRAMGSSVGARCVRGAT